MNAYVKSLQEQARDIALKMSVIEEKKDKSDADVQSYTELVATGKKIRKQLDEALEAQEFKAWGDQGAGSTVGASLTQEITGPDDREQEKHAQDAAAKSAYKAAFEKYLRGGMLPTSSKPMSQNDMKILREGAIKAESTPNDTLGGFTVPEDFQAEVLKKLPGLISLWDSTRHVPTGRDVLVFPVVRYSTDNKKTSPFGLTWTGDLPASATQADVTDETWGQARIPVNVAMAGQKLSNSFIEDAAVDVMGITQQLFRENILQDLENVIAVGVGGIQPEGITINATAQSAAIHSGNASALTADGLKDLYWNVPAQYRSRGKFVMSSSTAQAISKLKDANNRYLWEDKDMFGGGLGGAQLDGVIIPTPRLLGAPVLFSEQMPAVGASNYPIVFGDLSGYIVAERVGMTVRVLNELYAETDMVKILLRVRVGGLLAEDWKVRLQIVSA